VCVISDDPPAGDGATVACWLAHLGVMSARRHLQLTFIRSPDPVAGALRLDALGVVAMTGMVYVDPDFGPSVTELFDAARVSDGWPGRFLAALGGGSFDRASAPAFAAHEASVPYTVATPSPPPPAMKARVGRMASALDRAERRAVDLARAGRHASAARLLARATRLLETRGATAQAARCALRSAWIARSRGDITDAWSLVDRAGSVSDHPEIQVEVSIAVGTLRADDGRYVEAEAALRGAIAGAKALGRVDLARRGALALGRALLWNERTGEALAAVEGLSDPVVPEIACEALALAGRIHAAAGDVAAALGASSQAVQRSALVRDPRLEAAAHRAMALALAMAGDAAGAEAHARSGLRAAQLAHLPLTALRLRAALLRALSSGGIDRTGAQRLRESLAKAVRTRTLPAVVRAQVDTACDAHDRGERTQKHSAARRDAATIVAELVDTAQRAADDSAALGRVLEVVCERLDTPSAVLLAGPNGSRVLAQYGRPWREHSLSGRRALETGAGVGVDPAVQPPEAAQPVKYAGNTIAAVACRWTAGRAVDGAAAAIYLGAAALALSTHTQMLLDEREPPPHAAWGDLLGESPAAVSLREAIQRAARAPFPVLIEGESGSGKELVARAIHRLGVRRDRRFCAINCAAITDELVEAELFGHARGAFTGAATERPGLFEEADGGSLFLDEIGELSVRAQAKLLRVLQDGEVRRVGENLPRRVDVRLIAATNRRLEHEVEAGRFRADLRFRLDVVRIAVPALRDRVADIALLAARFWQDASARVGSHATLGPDALAALSRYEWPGNVRELQNAIAWIAVHAPRRGRVGASLLPARVAASAPLSTGTFEAAREDFERRFVRATLARTGGHRARTAQALGVSRQGLAKMLKRLGIE
jgi:DNA-binding NtrC family response regulator